MQVLTPEQQSYRVSRPPIFGGFEFTIQDILYSLGVHGSSPCSNLTHVCVEFKANQEAVPARKTVPFTVVGVKGEKGEKQKRQKPSALRTCVPFPICEG